MIAGNLYRAWMIPKMGYYSRHPEKYSEQFRYEYDRYAINLMKKTGRITTVAFAPKINTVGVKSLILPSFNP